MTNTNDGWEDVNNEIHSLVCLVVVLYNPTVEQISFYEGISLLGYKIIAVDNSNRAIQISNDINYIPLYRNLGIAAAQNVGIEEALRRGFKYVCFFDQDSKFDLSYIPSIYKEYLCIQKADTTIGTVGPLLIDERTQKEYLNRTDPNNEYEIVTHIISSGSIVEMSTFDMVGLYEERLFIDLVDSEWCWRAKKFGRTTYMTRRVRLNHSMGQKYRRIGNFAYGLSSPKRYYYQYRNTLWMLARSYVPFRWKYRIFLRRIFDMFLYPLITPKGKKEVLLYMIKGIYDGFKGL